MPESLLRATQHWAEVRERRASRKKPPPQELGGGQGRSARVGDSPPGRETAARPSRAAPRRGTTWGRERGPDPKLRRLRRPLAVAITSRSLDAANARSGARGTARTASGNLGNPDELTSRLTFCFPPPRPGRSSPRGTPPQPARHQQPQDSVGTMTFGPAKSARQRIPMQLPSQKTCARVFFLYFLNKEYIGTPILSPCDQD